MKKDATLLYSTEQLNKDIELVSEITNRLKDIIWCNQTPEFDFDKLPKVEQIQMIGLYKDSANFEHNLKMFKSWFRND